MKILNMLRIKLSKNKKTVISKPEIMSNKQFYGEAPFATEGGEGPGMRGLRSRFIFPKHFPQRICNFSKGTFVFYCFNYDRHYIVAAAGLII